MSLVGITRDYITVIKRVGTIYSPSQSFSLYECKCKCGNIVSKDSRFLSKPSFKHCGCYTDGKRSRVYPIFSKQDSDLKAIKWRKHPGGYAMTGWGNNKTLAHRVILERIIGRTLKDGELCDHINRNKNDNRRSNLRLADKSLNSVNRDIRPDNTTGFLGVYLFWPKEHQQKGWSKSWIFKIYRKGHKMYQSKHFKTPEEAYKARLEKLKEYSY